MSPTEPKVSVLMITYNHERFIAKSLRSVLDQQTDFDFEIVVGEDASTDRTREIVSEFAEKHSSIIRPVCHPKNVGGVANFHKARAECRGEFVAILEGDDYWTNPKKLATQVEALERNPEWSICCHRARIEFDDGRPSALDPAEEPTRFEFELEDLFERNFLYAATVMFRRALVGELPKEFADLLMGDWPLYALLAQHGKIGYIHETMAVYRQHAAGGWTSLSEMKKLKEMFQLYDAFEDYFDKRYAPQIRATRIKNMEHLFERIDELCNSRSYRLGLFFMRPLGYIRSLIQKVIGKPAEGED